MKLPLLTSSACVLALLTTIGCGSASRSETPTGEERQRIEGGQYDPDHTSVVGMYMQSGWSGGMCSGTLIAPNLVLTARHCVSSMMPDSEYVLCGESTFGTPHSASDFYVTTDMQLSQNSDWHQGAEVRVPAESSEACGFDQALVILGDSVPGITPYVPRIDIEATTDEPYTAVGYGQTGESSYGNWGGSRMVLGGLTVKCGAGECSFGGIQSTEFLGDTGICSGDSGGPALDANGKVIGVVSRGAEGCESPIYGAVSAWRDWIMEVAIEAATKGAYEPPFWALSGKSDPESGTAGGGGEGGSGGGSSTGGSTSSGGGNAQGQTCSASVSCPSGYLCLNAEGGPYCGAVCSATKACAGGLTCSQFGACENAAAPDTKSADSGNGGGCTIGGDERGPVKPVPWLVGLAILSVPVLCAVDDSATEPSSTRVEVKGFSEIMDELEEIASRRVGQTVGEWNIERVLGIGAMASVFAGTRSDGRRAALKILHPHFSEIPEVRKRFLREGPLESALAAMAPLCDGIPQVLEGGVSEDGAAYMAMELLVGETISERLARVGALPVDEALSLADQVLGVLVMAHAHGIIHRDLKPDNLHFGDGGRVKVLDFGIARLLDPLPDDVGALPEKTATKTGVALGTCDYMAPEQAMGVIGEIDGRTDLFGLGATLLHVLSGSVIHGDLPGSQLLIAAATESAPELASVAPHFPPWLCAVVDRSLAFAKTERYPDATSMRSDVRALRQGKIPPYVKAVADRRIAPGARL